MAADGDLWRYATPERPISEDQNILEIVLQRHLGKEPMATPETNTLEYFDHEYGQEEYEEDYYPDEVSMLRQQLDEALRANEALTRQAQEAQQNHLASPERRCLRGRPLITLMRPQLRWNQGPEAAL